MKRWERWVDAEVDWWSNEEGWGALVAEDVIGAHAGSYAIYRALTMSSDERSWRAEGLKKIISSRDPGDWVDDQMRDIEAKRSGARLGPGGVAAQV